MSDGYVPNFIKILLILIFNFGHKVKLSGQQIAYNIAPIVLFCKYAIHNEDLWVTNFQFQSLNVTRNKYFISQIKLEDQL